MCAGSYVHLLNKNGEVRVEVFSGGAMLLHAAGHLQIEGESIQIKAKGGGVQTKFGGKSANTQTSGRNKPLPGKASGVSASGSVSQKCVDKVVAAMPPEYRHSPTARQTVENLLAESKKQGVTDKAQIAYMLATAQRESSFGTDMAEAWGPHQVPDQQKYDAPGDPKNLGNQPNDHPNANFTNGDGYKYRGRGYVQITGKRHYEEWSKTLGVDLVSHPELAAEPQYASQIMVQGMTKGLFTGRSLSHYVDSSKGLNDFFHARQVVNGHNRAGEIAGNAQTYLHALKDCQ